MPTLASARNSFPRPTLLAVLVALLLALIPALAAAQLPAQIVVNANFEGGFSVVPNPDPLDGSSPDDIPNGWTRFETFSGGVEGSVLFQRTDNGPSRPGSNSLGISRVDGGTSGDWTAVRQDLDLLVNDCAALDLNIDVLVERQELAAGGTTASPAFEWPILVQIDYTTTGGPPQVWRHGWYIDPPGDGNPDDAGSGLIPVFEDTLVPANHWIHSHFDLLDELPQALLVNRITVGGAGWDFEGAVDNVRIRCTPKALQLNARRFEVEAEWRTFQGTEGSGRPQQLTEDSGTFWFFDPDNIELQVKVLDACVPPFDHFWVFAAGLTNVEVTLRVTDTVTDETRTYHNELGEPFETILDTEAFATCDQRAPVVCADFGPPLFAGQVAGAPAGLIPGGTLFEQAGIAVSLHELRSPSGGALFDHGRVTNPEPVPGFGNGQTALLNNVALGFDLTGLDFVPRQVTFAFADLGGFENLRINGSPSPIFSGELIDYPCPQAGVDCSFTVDPGGIGTATLAGPVMHVRIGGQELFLDEVCAWR